MRAFYLRQHVNALFYTFFPTCKAQRTIYKEREFLGTGLAKSSQP